MILEPQIMKHVSPFYGVNYVNFFRGLANHDEKRIVTRAELDDLDKLARGGCVCDTI